MSAMISVTSEFHISWNSVMIASPQTIMMDPNHVGKRLIDLQEYFDPQQVNSLLNPKILMTDPQIRDVVGNNPNIFLMNWSDLKKIMGFLESTMNVSARRVSITPASLTHPLAFYQTRYQVLTCSYHFNHCSHVVPHLGTRVPMGTFFSFWVPISLPRSPFSPFQAEERAKSWSSHCLLNVDHRGSTGLTVRAKRSSIEDLVLMRTKLLKWS